MTTVNLSGLVIDNRCLGDMMLLTKVLPYNAYVDNKKTDKVIGYKYTVILLGKGFQSLDVKIESDEPLVRIPVSADYVSVKFTGLEVKLYYGLDRRVQLSAKAENVSLSVGDADKAI